MSDSSEVIIYTDGSCQPNPGTGGWAAILRWEGQEKVLSGAQPDSTNNRMELQAAVSALQALKRPCQVRIFTDSQYLRKGITEWIKLWQVNGWRTSQKKAVLNADLWQALLAALAPHQVKWEWVKGHASNPYNERCDRLAQAAREKFQHG